MPCWTISYFSSSFGLRTPASDPRGTRDIDSTPPAITTSAWPVMTSIEAKLKACSPEAHIRFTLVPGTASRIERIHADHVPRGIRRFSTSRLPRRDKETGFHAPRPVRGLDPEWAGRDSCEKGQACGDHPQREPYVRQLLRHLPRCERY